MNNVKQNRASLAALLVVIGLVGCGPSRESEFLKEANNTNMKKAGSLYQLYASRHAYTGPASKEELMQFLTTNDKIVGNLERLGMDRDTLDQYFVSENDNQEFEFRWGVFIDPDTERSREPLVFEKEGTGGIRRVMLSNRKILEVSDDAKYQQLLSGRVSRQDALTEDELQEQAEAAGGFSGA